MQVNIIYLIRTNCTQVTQSQRLERLGKSEAYIPNGAPTSNPPRTHRERQNTQPAQPLCKTYTTAHNLHADKIKQLQWNEQHTDKVCKSYKTV
jgi:hypothetical protein